jgi:hypothetical protein
LAAAAEALREQVLEIEKMLLVPDLASDWAAYNHGVRLLAKLTAVSDVAGLGDYPPTAAAGEVFTELCARIDEQLGALDNLLKKDLAAFNKRVAEAKLGAVVD